jgi:hypothetical protein
MAVIQNIQSGNRTTVIIQRTTFNTNPISRAHLKLLLAASSNLSVHDIVTIIRNKQIKT